MKGKLLLTREGGGAKTEIRPNQSGEGWTVLDFEYDEDGKRKKLDEKRGVADGYVVELLRKQDPDFFELFRRLAQHPELQS